MIILIWLKKKLLKTKRTKRPFVEACWMRYGLPSQMATMQKAHLVVLLYFVMWLFSLSFLK